MKAQLGHSLSVTGTASLKRLSPFSPVLVMRSAPLPGPTWGYPSGPSQHPLPLRARRPPAFAHFPDASKPIFIFIWRQLRAHVGAVESRTEKTFVELKRSACHLSFGIIVRT